MSAPPKVVLLVHQQMLPGKAGESERLEVETGGNPKLGVPAPWIEREAVTGAPGALFLDPATLCAEMDRAGEVLGQVSLAGMSLESPSRLSDKRGILDWFQRNAKTSPG